MGINHCYLHIVSWWVVLLVSQCVHTVSGSAIHLENVDWSANNAKQQTRLLLSANTSTATATDVNNNNNSNSQDKLFLFELDVILICPIGISLLLLAILLISRILQSTNCCWRGTDLFDNSAACRYVTSVLDFWTDVLFAFRLSSESDGTTDFTKLDIKDLYIFSIIFVILPLISSMIFIIYWIYKWRAKTVSVSHRITNYLASYSPFLVLLSVFGSFHSTVQLIRSKLFGLNVFHFPLKEKEFEKLWIWRFVNQTVLEVCCIVMQLSYSYF